MNKIYLKISIILVIVLSVLLSSNVFAGFTMETHWNNLGDGWGHLIYSKTISGNLVIDGLTDTPDKPNALKWVYPKGWKDGGEPAKAWYVFPEVASELWVQYYFKYSSNYSFHPVGTKQSYFFIGPATGGYKNNFWIGLLPRKMVWEMQGAESRNMFANQGTEPRIEAGRWYKVKIHMRINTPGVKNGLAELWLDDILLMRYTDVNFRSDSEGNKGWDTMEFTPVYGGIAGAVKPAEDYFFVDHTIISTSPIGNNFPTPTPTTKTPLAPNNLTVD